MAFDTEQFAKVTIEWTPSGGKDGQVIKIDKAVVVQEVSRDEYWHDYYFSDPHDNPSTLTFTITPEKDEKGHLYTLALIPGPITKGAKALSKPKEADLNMSDTATDPKALRRREQAESVLKAAGVI